jgi:micrococcal nuclease
VLRFAAFFAFLLASAAEPVERQGRVISIIDGDTIQVLSDRTPIRVRLYGIDAPERSQAYGRRARAFLSSAAFNQTVRLTLHRMDRNQRWIAHAVLPDGRDLSEVLLKAGYAWWFERYAPKDGRLQQMEQEARRHRRGLWADPRPVPPWEYRNRLRRTSPATITRFR